MGINYENTEIVSQGGGSKIVRKVSIKKGKGYKSVTKYRKGKKIHTIKKPIHETHIKLIKAGKFIPGLFSDCKTRKKRGGSDIEMGPDVQPVKPYSVPPDPERFTRYEEKERMRPVTPDEARKIFEGPNPQEREAMENKQMGYEDPRDMDPFITRQDEFKIFSGGKIKRRK